jgi:hypothetical protein
MSKTHSGMQPSRPYANYYQSNANDYIQDQDQEVNSIAQVISQVDESIKNSVNTTTLETWDVIAKNTLNGKHLDVEVIRLLKVDPPEHLLIVSTAKKIAGIVFWKKCNEKEHAAKAIKIQALEKLLSEMDNTNSESKVVGESCKEYCKILITEWITQIKKNEIAKVEKKISTTGLNLQELSSAQLTEEQYESVLKQGVKLDEFFDNLGRTLLNVPPQKIKKSLWDRYTYSEFNRIWSLGLYDYGKRKRDEKKQRMSARIEALNTSVTHSPTDLVKANLQFILAISIFANELKKASPNKLEIEKANQLLQESKQFSKPAEIASKFNFNDWEALHMNKTELNEAHHEILEAIQAAGCEKFVSKKDLDDVFKVITTPPKIRKQKETLKTLRTIAALLTLPIAWTVGLVTMLVLCVPLLIVGSFIFPISDIISNQNSITRYSNRQKL